MRLVGTFVLLFGLQRTNPISVNANAANALGTSMTEMLQTLSTIPSVSLLLYTIFLPFLSLSLSRNSINVKYYTFYI